MTPNHTSRAAGAVFWSGIEISARYSVQILVTIFLARLLSPGDFGLLAMLLVFTNVGILLADAGFGTALVQKRHTSVDDESTVFWFNLFVGLLCTAALWFGAHAVAAFYQQPALTSLTRAISLTLLLSALGTVPDALLTQKLAFRARASAQMIASVLSGAAGVASAWYGLGVWSLVIYTLVGTTLRTACVWAFSGWRPRAKFSMAAFRNLFRFGGFMLISGLLDTLAIRLQAVLIGRLFDARAVGYYSLAQDATRAPPSFVGTLLSRVGLPLFSNVADDPARLRNALRSSLNVSMFVLVPCMVGFALAARPLIVAVYGRQWEAASPIASLLALAGALWPMHVLNLVALNAQGHSHRFFYLELIKSAITIAGIAVAAPFGVTAVAEAVLAAGLCNAGVNTWYSHQLLGYGAWAQLSDQRWTFLLAALAALPAWGILHWTPSSAGMVVCSIIVAASVYVGLAAAIQLTAWTQLLGMIRAVVQPRPINKLPHE